MATRRAALGSDVDRNRLAPSIFNLISGAVWFREEKHGGIDGGDCGVLAALFPTVWSGTVR